jgi:predicted nuclease of restriction endonuclease-like (RecB) superfamily
MREAASQMWGTRTLDRNIASQYYFRLLKSQDKQSVEDEMKAMTKSQPDRLEFIMNPVVFEVPFWHFKLACSLWNGEIF